MIKIVNNKYTTKRIELKFTVRYKTTIDQLNVASYKQKVLIFYGTFKLLDQLIIITAAHSTSISYTHLCDTNMIIN